MVFQEQSLVLNLTVAENIYLGQEDSFTRFGIVNWRAMNEAARRQLGHRAHADGTQGKLAQPLKGVDADEPEHGHASGRAAARVLRFHGGRLCYRPSF